jgi:hypothetical protein
MLRFFRSIRQNLLNENKTVQYLKYAIGEIFLIMIGIFLALELNNWNEGRQLREKERVFLQDLAENLALNIDNLQDELHDIERFNESTAIIFSLLKNPQQDIESVDAHWHGSLINKSQFNLSVAGYESLKNSGFDIVQNETLKKEIINLHEDTYLKMDRSRSWGVEFPPLWDKFVVEHFFKSHTDTGETKKGLMPRDINFITKSDYFFGLVETAESQRNFIKDFYETSLEETQRVLELINAELAK